MNICYISDVDISVPDGPGVNELEFVRTMQSESDQRGDSVSYVIPRPSNSVEVGLKNVEYFVPEPKKLILRLFRMFFAGLMLVRCIRRKVTTDCVDFFLIRISPSILPVLFLLSLVGMRYCIKTLGNTYQFIPWDIAGKKRFFYFFIRKMLGYVLRKSLFTDVCTPQLNTNYKNKFTLENISVIENAVNTNHFFIMNRSDCKRKYNLNKFKKLVGYCGGFPSQRGARQLIELSPRLVKRYPDLGILIIGHDSELEGLKKHVEDLRTIENIVFTGVVDYDKLPLLINCLDVGIALDTVDKIRFVGNSSQKIRQYISCGVPVICPENTNIQIVTHGFGISVCPEDLNSIFKAICFFIDSSEIKSEDFRKKCHSYARKSLSLQYTYQQRYNEWAKAIREKKIENNIQ